METVKKTVKKVARKPAVTKVKILCRCLYDGDDKYIQDQEYTVSRAWAESVVKADTDNKRKARIEVV